MLGIVRGLMSLVARLILCSVILYVVFEGQLPNVTNFSDAFERFSEQFDLVESRMASEGIPNARNMLVGGIVFLTLGILLVAVGFIARLGAFMLLVVLCVGTYYFHDFWTVEDTALKQDQIVLFLRNLALIGAMLFMLANGSGAGGLDNPLFGHKLLEKPNGKV